MKQMMNNISGDKTSSSPFSGFGKPSFSSGTAFKKAKSDINITYEISDKVAHPKFGKGQVVEISGQGDSLVLTVDFKEHGIKKIFAAIAPIEKV